MTRPQLIAAELEIFVRDRFGFDGDKAAFASLAAINIWIDGCNLYCRVPQFSTRRWHKNTFVIASLSMQPMRSGHATALLRLLCQRLPEHGITHIGIEQATGGESMDGFLEKFGFVSTGGVDADWIVGIDGLRERIEDRGRPDACA